MSQRIVWYLHRCEAPACKSGWPSSIPVMPRCEFCGSRQVATVVHPTMNTDAKP